MWEQVLETALPLILKGIGVLLGLGLTWLVAKVIKKFNLNEAEQNAIEALAAGVNDVYLNYVKDLKAKAEDGKLTDEEKKAAKTMAINKAKQLASGSGKKLIATMAEERLGTWVDKLVNKAKK